MNGPQERNALRNLNRKVNLIERMRDPLRDLADWEKCLKFQALVKNAQWLAQKVINTVETKGDEIPSDQQLAQAERIFDMFLEKFAELKTLVRRGDKEECCSH